MVTYLPRSAWGARPPEGTPASLSRAEVVGDVIHWPGSSSRIDATGDAGFRRVASALRGWQEWHMDGRGWSDIAYQVAVDQVGRAWTLRGLNIRSAANGDATVNRKYGAILLVLGPGEAPSSAMKSTVRGVVADFRRMFPAGTAIRPHSAVREGGTDCPGDEARAAIARGEFTPGTTTEDELSAEDVRAIETAINAAAARLETNLAAKVEASGRRWALYQRLYEIESADDLEAAAEAYREAREAGKSVLEAQEIAEAKLAPLRTSIKEAQANG